MSASRVRVIGASVPGAAHCRTGCPNQDAIAWLPNTGAGDRVVMAVSDGHGGAASPRSRSGSRLAVEIATSVLWRLPHQLSETALRAAMERIAREWRSRVEARLARRPLAEAELAEAERRGGPGTRQLLVNRPLVAYGATLLLAVVDSAGIAVGQLGDGDVLLVAADGRVHRPLPSDQRLVAHVTTSLCDDDPGRDTRWALLPADSALVLLATDGYANSFATDQAFLQVGADLLDNILRSGIEEVGRSLPRWLRETTQQGAGDDITVGVALLPATVESSRLGQVLGITAIVLGLAVIIAGLAVLGRPPAQVSPVAPATGTSSTSSPVGPAGRGGAGLPSPAPSRSLPDDAGKPPPDSEWRRNVLPDPDKAPWPGGTT